QPEVAVRGLRQGSDLARRRVRRGPAPVLELVEEGVREGGEGRGEGGGEGGGEREVGRLGRQADQQQAGRQEGQSPGQRGAAGQPHGLPVSPARRAHYAAHGRSLG